MSGVCSMHQGHVPDGGHAAPTSWEHAEAVPGMWHTPRTVHIPVTRLTCLGHVACTQDAFSVFPGCIQRVPRMWGQHACHVACVPSAWNTPPMHWTRSARRTHHGCATGTCTVPGMCHMPG